MESEIPKTLVSSADSGPKPLLSENGNSRGEVDLSGGEDESRTRRSRPSRWDPQPGRKRKSRWADDEPKPVIQLPDFMKEFTGGVEFNPELQALNSRCLEISRMLQSGLPLDDRPEGARSPSPEPIYDNRGIRINTREYRARERLTKERQDIISQMIKINPAYKPPSDYRPRKIQKKLYIPMKECPGYNFIGLIIGPRGNTQKRMERETGAKIVIRGKGSMKEGRFQQKRDLKPDPSENEDLHVLVEGETQEAVDAAAAMVEKLLQPVDEVLNEHKRQQLRELATLNGTIRAEEYCRLCGEPGHRQYACPSRTTTFKSDVLCKICGDGGHPTIDCPMKGTTGKKMDDEYQNFLAELGGTMPESSTKGTSTLALGSGGSGTNPSWASDTGGLGSSNQAGFGASGVKSIKEYDDTNLYIAHLPPNIDDDGLIGLFSSFGDIVMAKVVKDRVSGLSKGYGFVKYLDVQMANNAIVSMNGYRIEGRTISVRVAGKPPQPTVPPGPPTSTMPPYTVSNPPVGAYPSQQFTPGGPLASAPPPASYGWIPPMYSGTAVPWGAPPPPPPPPPGSTSYPPVPGQPILPYGVQYPPAVQTIPSTAPTQTVTTTETQKSYPPGVYSENNSSAPPAPSNIHGNPVAAMPSISHPAYATPPLGFSSYYSAVPPPPPVPAPQNDHSQGMTSNMPWASNQPVPPPGPSASEKTNGTDVEHEK